MSIEKRWIQRFNNFKKSLRKLSEIVDDKEIIELTEIERDSIIKRFELTFELSWNLLKDFLELQGYTELYGSRNTFRIAFERGIIHDGEMWMEMIESRIKSAHTYDEENANDITNKIYSHYIELFNQLRLTMEKQVEQ